MAERHDAQLLGFTTRDKILPIVDIVDSNVYIIDYINLKQDHGTLTEEQYNALKSAIENNKIIIVKFTDSDIDYFFNMFAPTSGVSYRDNKIIQIILYFGAEFDIININPDYSYNILIFPFIIDKKGTVGQVLTKTEHRYEWQDPQTGDTFPEGGTVGQVLKKTSNGVAWQNDNNTTYNKATQQADGLMSKEDKAKLDGLAEASL